MDLKKIWQNREKILEGIKNSLFTKEHIELVAEGRLGMCKVCEHLDKKGESCQVPGTNPCCKLCGCSLHLKTRSLSSGCDDKRWYPVLTQREEDILNERLGIKPE